MLPTMRDAISVKSAVAVAVPRVTADYEAARGDCADQSWSLTRLLERKYVCERKMKPSRLPRKSGRIRLPGRNPPS